MTRRKPSFRDKFRYNFDNLVSRGPAILTYLLIFSTVLIVFLFTIIFLLIEPDSGQGDIGFFEIVWINLMHTIDPGAVVEDGGGWSFKILMLFLTLIGIVVISTFIGLVSNGILTKFQDLRKGRSKIIEENHILILGWSSKIHSILSELIIANENQNKPVIAILADMDKIEMEDEIREKIPDLKNMKIICRSGNPIDLSDLEIANPYNSRSIIILDTEKDNSDVEVIKTILAITANPKRRKDPYHIVAEIIDEKNLQVAKMVGKDEVELILSDEFISRIIVQTSRQSGLSVVYTDFLDFDGDELYFYEEKKLFNKTFRDALFSYNTSCIIGLHMPDGSILINPPVSTVITPGTEVIALSEDDDTVVLSEGLKPIIDQNAILEIAEKPQKNENYLIIGWNHRTKIVIKELLNYILNGSSISILSEIKEPIKFLMDLREKHPEISIDYQKASTTDSEVLEQLELSKYNHILIQSYLDNYPLQEADAKTLITLLHLRRKKEILGHDTNIVTEMLDINNRELAKITKVDDFIISYNIISLVMSQVSENKKLMRVFEHMFQADGQEVYIRPINHYIKTGISVNFYTLLDSALRKKEIAIGYRKMSWAKDSDHNYGIVLNPDKAEETVFEEHDCIIVIAED